VDVMKALKLLPEDGIPEITRYGSSYLKVKLSLYLSN
jgi:hypothetical protein